MKPFVLNRHGRLVFPSNFVPELDFGVLQDLERLDAVIARDFEAKAPTGTELLERVEGGAYASRHGLLRDVALNLFWVNRYAMTMYDKRPTRWRDVPRRRDDVYLPVLTPWPDGARKVAAVRAAYEALPPTWDADAEDRVFGVLFDLFAHRLHDATELPAVKPTVAEMLERPERLTFRLPSHDPDFPVVSQAELRDLSEDVPELESLHRLALVLHNQYPWERAQAELRPVGELGDDDFVVLFTPRTPEVQEFLARMKARPAGGRRPARRPPPAEAVAPVAPYPPLMVRERFAVQPRLEALAVVKGEHACTNDDLVRNGAYNWSPMSAEDVARKTGIEARRYTERGLDQIALDAAERALRAAGRTPAEIGAVLFCSCTSTRLIPSLAAWLTGQLGIAQTHASVDLIAACAGFPYGLAEATRLLQEVERPVLLVCGEKFSDKIGPVRTSRMIFGDGAAALVVAPAPAGEPGDVDVLQTYAGGPVTQVESIIWPNPEFDNDITVYGPEVKALAGRYLEQMMGELRELGLVESVELVVPHQANRTMVTDLAARAGLEADQLYFDIGEVGNVSAASIPLALHDAVRDGVIDRPLRVFAPGFGAGAVGGYAVLRVDPAIVALDDRAEREDAAEPEVARTAGASAEDVVTAFG